MLLAKTQFFLGEVNTGRVREEHGKNWVCRYGLGDLLLCMHGRLRLTVGNMSTEIGPGSLVLIQPVPAISFYVVSEEPWEGQWAHFKMEGHLESRPAWPSPIPGVCCLDLAASGEAAERFYSDFAELAHLDSSRDPGWYRLFYSLLDVMILRGNMLSADQVMDKRMVQASELLKAGVSIDECARKIGMSRSSFFRNFLKTFDMPPRLYCERALFKRACLLLQNSGKTISEIAEECGFRDSLYFSSRFRKFFGCSPRTFRKEFLQKKDIHKNSIFTGE